MRRRAGTKHENAWTPDQQRNTSRCAASGEHISRRLIARLLTKLDALDAESKRRPAGRQSLEVRDRFRSGAPQMSPSSGQRVRATMYHDWPVMQGRRRALMAALELCATQDAVSWPSKEPWSGNQDCAN